MAQATAWLNARSHMPLQYQYYENIGGGETVRILKQERLPPGALPASFFDWPYYHHRSLWNQVTDWITGRAG